MERTKGLTQAKVKAELKAIGICFRVNRAWGEYMVYLPGQYTEASYTTDLEDALDTGKAMAEWAKHSNE